MYFFSPMWLDAHCSQLSVHILILSFNPDCFKGQIISLSSKVFSHTHNTVIHHVIGIIPHKHMFTWKYTKLSTGSKTNSDNCLILPLSLPLSQSLHLKVKQAYTGPMNMKQEVHTARTASRCNCGKDYSRKRFKP